MARKNEIKRPAIGDTVIYVLPGGVEEQTRVRPAKVLEVDPDLALITCEVVGDFNPPIIGRNAPYNAHDAKKVRGNTWHWPEPENKQEQEKPPVNS